MSSDLLTPDASSRSLTYFALGGSGIRALEPLLHLCALGLGPRQLNVVLIDPDQSNAAVTRSRELLDLYRKVRGAITEGGAPEDGYFRTEVKDIAGSALLWSPIADAEGNQDATFQARVDRPLMDGGSKPLGQLFDLLYADRMRRMNMTLGFRGVPSIGTVFMNRLREQKFFHQLLVDAQNQPDSVFFSVGSVFGGTGAAALPVVGRALTDGIPRLAAGSGIPGVPAWRVGSVIMMPYFTLPTPRASSADDGGPRPEAAMFAQNAAAALPTYTAAQAGFGSYYVIGDDEPREQDKNEVGGAGQANRSHYVELYAALAALDFAARGGEKPTERLPVFQAVGIGQHNVRWADLPLNDRSRRRLMGGFVAAHTFLSIFRPDAKPEPELGDLLHGTTWMQLLGMDSAQLQRHSALLDDLGRFFMRTWQWVGEMGSSTPALELVRASGRAPSELRLHETVEGRRPAKRMRETSSDGYEVFRHWNVAAHRASEPGIKGMFDVMREGSEGFAAERFAVAN
jgi:hypothetical protein